MSALGRQRLGDFLRAVVGAALAALAVGANPASADEAQRVLRVCADPDNLPYSHRDGSGFENRIARVVADELKAELRFEWQVQRFGWVRKTLGAGVCDAFIGVPVGFELVAATRPYYRSSYVFVNGAGGQALTSFDDPRVAKLRIGVQLVGDDLAATPPGHALVDRGAIDNVVGFPVSGDGPAADRITTALAAGDLDAAVVWGPQAGWYARRHGLRVFPAKAPPGFERLPFEFSIAMGVRRGDTSLREALDGVIERRRADIDAILADYDVPRTDAKR